MTSSVGGKGTLRGGYRVLKFTSVEFIGVWLVKAEGNALAYSTKDGMVRHNNAEVYNFRKGGNATSTVYVVGDVVHLPVDALTMD